MRKHQGILHLLLLYLLPFTILIMALLFGAPVLVSGQTIDTDAIGSTDEQQEWEDSWQNVTGDAEAEPKGPSLFGYVEVRGNTVYDEGSQQFRTGFSSRFRLKGEWQPSDCITARMEILYHDKYGTINPLTVYNQLGINPQTLLQSDNPQDSFVEGLDLDHAWAVVNLGNFDLSFGKLPLAWGNAWLYNPTDRLSATPALEDREAETTGTIAVIPVWYPGDCWAIEGTLVFAQRGTGEAALIGSADPGNLPLGLRVKGYAAGFDFSFSAVREVWYTGAAGGYLPADPTTPAESWEHGYFIGLDTVGSIGPLGMYLEATLAIPQSGNSIDFQSDWEIADAVDLSTGLEYMNGPYTAKTEFIYSSAGTNSPETYDPGLLLGGRSFLLARQYLLIYGSRTIGDFFETIATALINLNDGSSIVSAELMYPFRDNFEASASCSWPFGPAESEFNGKFDLGTGKIVDIMQPEISVSLKTSF